MLSVPRWYHWGYIFYGASSCTACPANQWSEAGDTSCRDITTCPLVAAASLHLVCLVMLAITLGVVAMSVTQDVLLVTSAAQGYI